MSRHFPPDRTSNRTIARWLIGAALTLVPLAAVAEVTLSTSVERISSAVPIPAEAGPADPAGAAARPAQSSPALPDTTPSEVFSGDVLRYTIVFENRSTQDVAAGSVVITNPLPEETIYLEGSATGDDTLITYSVDGETFGPASGLLVGQGAQARAATASDIRVIRWTYEPMLPSGASSQVSFELLIP